jgi:hypothetical protein
MGVVVAGVSVIVLLAMLTAETVGMPALGVMGLLLVVVPTE